MIGSLNTSLQTLKETLARHPEVVPVLTHDALEKDFHGLNVSQVARLVSAPALGYVEERRTNQGGAMELLLIDGADDELKAQTLQKLLIERDPPARPEDMHEFVVLDWGAVRETLLRDHDNTVYRLRGQQPVVDEQLTTLVRQSREAETRRAAPDEPVSAYHRSIVIRDPIAVSAMIGRILQMIGDLHHHNQQALAAAGSLTKGPGLAAAVTGVDSGRVERAAVELSETARRGEATLEELRRAVDALIALLDSAEPVHPHLRQ